MIKELNIVMWSEVLRWDGGFLCEMGTVVGPSGRQIGRGKETDQNRECQKRQDIAEMVGWDRKVQVLRYRRQGYSDLF